MPCVKVPDAPVTSKVVKLAPAWAGTAANKESVTASTETPLCKIAAGHPPRRMEMDIVLVIPFMASVTRPGEGKRSTIPSLPRSGGEGWERGGEAEKVPETRG